MSNRNRNGSVDSNDDFAGDVFQIKSRKTAGHEKSRNDNKITFFKTFWLLVALGACAGFTTAFIIRTVRRLTWFHADLIHDASTNVGNRWLGYFYFCLSTTCCATTAAWLCKYISREASGAGMPNVKYLLAASSLAKMKELKNQFTFKVLFVKVFGNILAAGSSLVAGNVGPFVHISACIASVLMRHVPYFQAIRKSEAISKQIYGASAAVGLSSAFNAPLGGLLFSVEITSTYYLLSNYWKSFVCACTATGAYYIVLVIIIGVNAEPTIFPMANITPCDKWELIIFPFLGIFFGYLSKLYLMLIQFMFVNIAKPNNPTRPLVVAFLISLASALIELSIGAFDPNYFGVKDMITNCLGLGNVVQMEKFGNIHPTLGAFIYAMAYPVLAAGSMQCALPAGTLMPTFLVGAVWGRFIARIIDHASRSGGWDGVDIPSYTLIGAVAFTSGATQTISMAVIGVEITGNIKWLFPALLAATASCGVSQRLGLGLYDQAMVNRGMTTFQHLLKSSSTRSEAMDVMDDDMFSVPAFCTVGNVIKLLELTENRQINFPIVQDMKTMKIVGSIKRRELFSFLHNMFEKVKRLDDLRKLLPFDADNFDLILRKAEIEEKKKRGILSAFRRESVSIAKSFRISSDSSPSFLSWFSRNRAGGNQNSIDVPDEADEEDDEPQPGDGMALGTNDIDDVEIDEPASAIDDYGQSFKVSAIELTEVQVSSSDQSQTGNISSQSAGNDKDASGAPLSERISTRVVDFGEEAKSTSYSPVGASDASGVPNEEPSGVRRRRHTNEHSTSPEAESSSDADNAKSMNPVVRNVSGSPRERSASQASATTNAIKRKDSEGGLRSNSDLSGDAPAPELRHKNSIFEGIIEAGQKGLAGIGILNRSRGPSSANGEQLYDSYNADTEVHSFMHWRIRKNYGRKSLVKTEAEEELHRKAEYWEQFGISSRMSELSFDPSSDLMQLLSNSMNVSTNPNLTIDYHPFVVQKTATVDEVYLLFEMVKVKFVYVVDRDSLVGMIDMKILIDGLKNKIQRTG